MHKKLSGVWIMAYTTIDDPSAHFQIALYTGNGSSQSITFDGNSDLQPDWLWTKARGDNSDPIMRDTSRGIDKRLLVHATDAEGGATGTTSFNSDGFSLDSTGTVNANGNTFVGWAWKANGGSTTSFSASGAQLAGTRQSNTTAGFSIITYTGDGNNNATIPHGLNSAPKFVIIKDRGNATNWYVGHNSIFTTGEIFLNLTNAVAAAFGPFNKTAPTASNIVLGTDGNVNGSSDTMVCYAFAEVQGYSKFGSFEGNGNADGPFVYTGFKPAWLLVKNADASHDWHLFDNKRLGRNPANERISPNLNSAAVSNDPAFDFLSNGFKGRNASSARNENNGKL
jgi:hypothetical protein